jgi:putative ABC transport system ATP-binding protein
MEQHRDYMNEDDYILKASSLHKSFGSGQAREHVLRGLDLRVCRGEFLAVMGPSGCGKSTLLHLLGLMSGPDEGTVVIDDIDTTGLGETGRAELRRRKIGFVFQRFNLISVLSGYDNIALSLRIRGKDTSRTGELLEAMGVKAVARKKPSQMSIGQQQRLAVARAIAHKPDILLADEPTGSLDSENAEALLELLTRANRQDGQTIVMITHSDVITEAAGRVVHMRDGKILDENH